MEAPIRSKEYPSSPHEPISHAPTYYSRSVTNGQSTAGDAHSNEERNLAGGNDSDAAGTGPGHGMRVEADPADLPFLIKTRKLILGTLNFYRIHMLAFIFIPFVLSGVFYASNTEYHISYIDCLFNCVSAMTVTGLATVNLSTLSGWQQAMLFIQMIMGSPTTVSLIMIMVRKHFFRQEFQHIIQGRREAKKAKDAMGGDAEQGFLKSPRTQFRRLSKSISRATGGNMGAGTTVPSEQDQSGTTSEPHDPEAQRKSLKGELRWRDLFRHNIHKGSTFKPENGVNPEEQVDGSESSHSSSERPPEKPVEAPIASSAPIRPQATRTASGFGGGDKKKKGLKGIKISADMIQRVDGGGSGLLNPMGWYNETRSENPLTRILSGRREDRASREEITASMRQTSEPGPGILDGVGMQNTAGPRPALAFAPSIIGGPPLESPGVISEASSISDVPRETSSRPASPARRTSEPFGKPAMLQLHDMEDKFPRSKTIAFDEGADEQQHAQRGAYASAREARTGLGLPRTGTIRSVHGLPGNNNAGGGNFPITRTMTGRGSISGPGTGRVMPHSNTLASGPPGFGMPRPYTMDNHPDRKYNHFGGFPTPIVIAKKLFEKAFPNATGKIQRTLTMQRTFSEASMGEVDHGVKEVTWISFDAIVGRNSYFHDLTQDEYDELGGVEYRALKLLFWVVLSYWIGWQFFGFLVIAPYIAAGNYPVFQQQYRAVPVYWFAAFQSVSAFSNTGMSLVDTSMIPFATAYLMIVMLILLIYAGNTAFPPFIRLTLWGMAKMVPAKSRIRETFSFVLDHPRRCFLYLFPSKETWVLVIAMVVLSSIDFVSFMVLDIGNPVIEDIPVGTRVAVAIMQSAAVRAAGFGIVALNALAPAVKVLYVIMMYIAVYPISMTLRSTNVYEEQSLGIFHAEEQEIDDSPNTEGRSAVLKYVGWHARRQLAFDVWWLAGSLWLVCIVERGAINGGADSGFFSIFSVLFELVSAYSTTGLSLGLADQNYSLSGDFRILSKLIVCAVMIRGRHRGLPVAIDRAVMLPKDFTVAEAQAFETEAQRTSVRRSSTIGSTGFDPSYMAGLGHSSINASVGGHRRTGSGSRNSFSHPGTARPNFGSNSEGSAAMHPPAAALLPIFKPTQAPATASGSPAHQVSGPGSAASEVPHVDLDSPLHAPRRGSLHGDDHFSRNLSTIREGTISRDPTQPGD